jgi:hypothetical protein
VAHGLRRSLVRKQLLIGLLSAGLVAAMSPGVAGAASGDEAAKNDCQQGGWEDRVDASGRPFANEGECVGYVSQGGGVPRLAEPITIAIAYSNRDATPGYGPSSDIMIAELLDIDGNGPDAGDEIHMESALVSFAPSFVDFRDQVLTVDTRVEYTPGTSVAVRVDGDLLAWGLTAGTQFFACSDNIGNQIKYQDWHGGGSNEFDAIQIQPGAPGDPAIQATVDEDRYQSLATDDDYFLEVEVN